MWQAGGVTPEDLLRAEALASTRRRATWLLALIALVFVATFFLGDARWVGYLRATAEAGLIGGLADWFAVVALFRHPLGIPIPHTAIIPTSKDGLGRSLATFVTQNFLDPESVVERLRDSNVTERVGVWLANPDHAATASRHLHTVGAAAMEASAETLGEQIDDVILERLATAPLPQIVGRGLRQLLAEDAHRPLVGAAVQGLHRVLLENRRILRRRLGTESPWWVPETVDDAVFDRAWEVVTRLLGEVEADEHHELRRLVDAKLAEVAGRLVEDEEYGETFRRQLLALVERPEIRAAVRHAWTAMTSSFDTDTNRIRDALQQLGKRLTDDGELRARVDEWLEGVTRPLSDAAGREVEAMIAQTIERWDTEEASRRLELWMGRDLQFVRINGTLVGALIGLTLHTVIDLLT